MNRIPKKRIVTDAEKLAAQYEQFKSNLPMLEQSIQLVARMKMIEFEALRKVGFTDPQAIQIVAGRG